MTKNFPKSRICVIDITQAFEHGIREAIRFCNQNNILLNSADGKRLLLNFCIKSMQQSFKNTKSPFQKVVCFGSRPKTERIQEFIQNHVNTLMRYFPVPYCGTIELNSPDLEAAAESSLQKLKAARKFINYTEKVLRFKS